MHPGILMSVAEALQIAIKHFEAGKFAQAEKIFARLLDVQPEQPDALHHAGVIAHKHGHPGAVDVMRRTVALSPGNAGYLNNLEVVLRAKGSFEEAMTCLHQAVIADLTYTVGHYNLALILLIHGDFAHGLMEYEWRWRTPFQVSGVRGTKPKWEGS